MAQRLPYVHSPEVGEDSDEVPWTIRLQPGSGANLKPRSSASDEEGQPNPPSAQAEAQT